MNLETSLGIVRDGNTHGVWTNPEVFQLASEMVDRAKQADGVSAAHGSGQIHHGPCPVDGRIEAFLNDHFADLTTKEPLRLPPSTLVLSRHGIARALSIPEGENSYSNPIVRSYRLRNGVLHNPLSDRRTTQGTFHVAEGGLPIPGDKKAVPRHVFVALLRHALTPPADLMAVPFTAERPEPLSAFVSLLLRPAVCPEVPGVCKPKSMEVRFFAPGSLVGNLDFVESVFGNAGDPGLPKNDAGLDVEHWTGHTGCVILAPHLIRLTKKELGLTNWAEATERQKRDGMCWRDPSEAYNEGGAFKVTCRTADGVIVTVIADNYFGYCKKEVKTQISYAANLYGNVEEEHSGGAVAFASYLLGQDFDATRYPERQRNEAKPEPTITDLERDYPGAIEMRPEGYAVDLKTPALIYIPGDAKASIDRLKIWWTQDGREMSIPLAPDKTYMTPLGYKVRLEKHPGAASWRLVGTVAEGLSCHKPCTVSGGGKSEISKSLRDYMLYGPIFVADMKHDFDRVQEIFDHEYSDRWKEGKGPDYAKEASRPVLSDGRTLGSVIKLLTPSEDYKDEYNAWLAGFPDYIFPIVFIIKRFLYEHSSLSWRTLFGVDSVNGFPGHELKAFNRKLVGTYLRVGLLTTQAWRTFKLRQDFVAADKIQTGDDITASVVLPANQLGGLPAGSPARSFKFTLNCEARLFQRPDDAIHRGLDRQTESDLSRPDNFLSNFEPLTSERARAMVERVTEFEEFTPPMQRLLRDAADSGTGYLICSANPRIVNGKPSKNPRYLQTRPDLLDSTAQHIAERGMRIARGLAANQPIHTPVGAVLMGRRNNPAEPEDGVRALAVYGPIHYQELPELFMDFIASLTGKSPSTTGAGSEGALTKGPFNALRPIHDLNAALVSYILTGLGGFSTAAGYVGPKMRVDHDISLLIPEIWCRMSEGERDPEFLIREKHLEPVEDRMHDGRKVLASRLGYRITTKFVRTFFGRVFDHPSRVFDEDFLRPERQDPEAFADGMHNIVEAQQRVARQYIEDGSIEDACPPLRALLHIMAEGTFEGRDVRHPEVRGLFTRGSLLNGEWYRERLDAKRRVDRRLWGTHLSYLEKRLARDGACPAALKAELVRLRELARAERDRIDSPKYVDGLVGTLGVDPSLLPGGLQGRRNPGDD